MSNTTTIDWFCKKTWKISAKNTAVCLLGCSIGDNLTILFFQKFIPSANMWLIMVLAMVAGLLTSISLETFIMLKHMDLKSSVKVAFGMSFISMLMMEAAANVTSIIIAGGNRLILSWYSLIPSWGLGYVAAWIYNYYKLKKHGQSCHG